MQFITAIEHNIPVFLVVWLAVGLILILRLGLYLIQKDKIQKLGFGDIDRIDCRAFQARLQRHFESCGYKVERKYIRECGADLVIKKDGASKFVHAKCHRKKTGFDAIQEAWFAKKHYNCDKLLVITNTFFSWKAKKAAIRNGIELWDRKELARSVRFAKKEKAVNLFSAKKPEVFPQNKAEKN